MCLVFVGRTTEGKDDPDLVAVMDELRIEYS